MKTISSLSFKTYSPSPSSSQSVSLIRTNIPGRLFSPKPNSVPLVSIHSNHYDYCTITYTVSFSINNSGLSFNKWSRRWCIRYSTSEDFVSLGSCPPGFGFVVLSMGTIEGIVRVCFLWLENKSSRPPPNSIRTEIVELGRGVVVDMGGGLEVVEGPGQIGSDYWYKRLRLSKWKTKSSSAQGSSELTSAW